MARDNEPTVEQPWDTDVDGSSAERASQLGVAMTDDLPEFFARVALDEVNQLVVVSGELDLVNAAHLGERLDAVIDSTDGDVVVDLANVTFIDSTGLRTVLVARDRLCRSDRTLAVRNPSVQVARLLEICGLCDLIELKHSGEAGAQDAAEPTADVVAASDGDVAFDERPPTRPVVEPG